MTCFLQGSKPYSLSCPADSLCLSLWSPITLAQWLRSPISCLAPNRCGLCAGSPGIKRVHLYTGGRELVFGGVPVPALQVLDAPNSYPEFGPHSLRSWGVTVSPTSVSHKWPGRTNPHSLFCEHQFFFNSVLGATTESLKHHLSSPPQLTVQVAEFDCLQIEHTSVT